MTKMDVQLKYEDFQENCRKCMDCPAMISNEINFANVRCWNCILKIAKDKGNHLIVKYIQEQYL